MNKTLKNFVVSSASQIKLDDPSFHMKGWHRVGLSSMTLKAPESLVVKFKHDDAERVTARSFVVKAVEVEWNNREEPSDTEAHDVLLMMFHPN